MIKEIIEDELVEIYFQPIVSIRTKTIYAFEALTRCTYNEEYINPERLFNLAKKESLNKKLDELTRRKSIEKFHNYYLKNKNSILFLNLESEIINDFSSINEEYSFIELIKKLGIPFKNFVLEIKEDEINNTKALEEFSKTFKSLGFSIALDDFGIGSSTFNRVNLIKPDIIKIDRSLFVDVKKNLINKEIVRAISKMSHNLGIRVLAEGVEDQDAICLAMKCSINLFQGFYFCKPVPEIEKKTREKIVEKSIEIGKLFKINTIEKINKKREVIKKYELISENIINQCENIESTYMLLEEKISSYRNLEAMYLIDGKSSKQINNTVMPKTSINKRLRPSSHGEEHYLKEYYYITLESKQGIYLSQKYISYATGNICKTFAKKFDLENKSYILCLDINVKE